MALQRMGFDLIAQAAIGLGTMWVPRCVVDAPFEFSPSRSFHINRLQRSLFRGLATQFEVILSGRNSKLILLEGRQVEITDCSLGARPPEACEMRVLCAT